MSDLPYKSWKNTPLDPTPPAPGSPASKLPPPTTAPFYRVFQHALVRNAVLAEVMLASALLGAGVVWWSKHSEEEREAQSGRGGNAASASASGAKSGAPDTRHEQITVLRERQ